MRDVKGTAKNMYEDHLFYEVEVLDLLSIDATSFVVGVNGNVTTYPTQKTIRMSGTEIKALMNAQIPKEEFVMENGFNRHAGTSYQSRFAITMKQFGTFPTEKATILQPFGSYAVHLDASKSLEKNPSVDSAGDISSMVEPVAEEPVEESPEIIARREELKTTSKDVLEAHAKSLGIKINSRSTKSTLVESILEVEETELGV